MILITSHRGYHKNDETVTENTITAFNAAKDLGVDSFELDVQLTSDNQWVINHDRKYFTRVIATSSSQELKRAAKENNVELNFLEEVLETFPDMIFNIECKSVTFDKGKKLATLLSQLNRLNNCSISSFKPDVLRGARSASKDIRLAYLSIVFIRNSRWIKLHEEINLFSINPFFRYAIDRLLNQARKRKVEVHLWTVNSEKDITKSLKRNIHSIITDYPASALELRKLHT
jgi:glycerophosphoryl diester phosphodiesterase